MLIDDEEPALSLLERLISDNGGFRIEGKYTSARAGLEHLAKSKVDVVFMDMDMPEVNGLKAGEHIQQMDPGILIIYVTAYSEYALEAFGIPALDYLLKPIDPKRLTKTLGRIAQHVPPTNHSTSHPWIRCFGQLSFEGADGEEKQLKWKTGKAQELFVYLLHEQERWVNKEKLLEALWPDYLKDKALTYLHTTVSQIRKLLREQSLPVTVEYSLDNYRLLLKGVHYDVKEFEAAVTKEVRITSVTVPMYEAAASLYRGDFLQEYDYVWAELKKNQLLEHYVDLVLNLADYEAANGMERQALRRLRELQPKCPYSEELCRRQLAVCARLNDRALLDNYFAKFAELLRYDLGVEPSPQLVRFYQQLHNNKPSDLNA
ncbi:response regulator [Paenibacillus sp. 32352]|uniref:response regulator n=1 Tax=Paenibacillus sp. 32352 TaxID=1969111 RepID=UPI0009ABCDAA|nr:response regulator [Paenibacillus sp. 32352]